MCFTLALFTVQLRRRRALGPAGGVLGCDWLEIGEVCWPVIGRRGGGVAATVLVSAERGNAQHRCGERERRERSLGFT